MKVNKRSWHYRFLVSEKTPPNPVQFADRHNENTTICVYFWSLVFTVVVWALIAALILCVVAVLVAAFHDFWPHSGFVVALLVVVLGAIRRWRREVKAHPPGLVRQTYRAAKRKVCPIIEFED